MSASSVKYYSPHNQRGLSFSSFLIALCVGVPLFITVIRTVPVYTEYFAIKRAMLRAAKECHECSLEEVRRLYGRQALIDEITSVKGIDLSVKRAPGKGEKGIAVSTEYSRKQELVEGSGISLLFEFQITEP